MARTLQCLWPSGVSPQEALQHPLFVDWSGFACTGSHHAGAVLGSGATTEEECQGLLLPDPLETEFSLQGSGPLCSEQDGFRCHFGSSAHAESTRVMS